MVKIIVVMISALILGAQISAEGTIAHLLPKVKMLDEKIGSIGFVLARNACFENDTSCVLLREILEKSGTTISGDASARVIVNIVDSIPDAYNHNVPLFPDEAYTLDISRDTITINALSGTGVIRAAQTIAQLAIDTDTLPPCRITDWPAFKVRGYMHDIGRSFISVEELKKEIRLLSKFKINTFHWHLTENQAWRFEVKAFPELTADSTMTRFPGKFYTQDECREVMAEARKHGVILIPEIDMPGHSDAFVRAMGHEMQTQQGKAVLKIILEEAADVFSDAPYIHIGGDEVAITDPTFLPEMIEKLHSLGKKAVCWNPIRKVNIGELDVDMTQMWSTAGKKIPGIPNIDCRYNYINHFDVFADVVGIFKSSIYYEQMGTDDVAGTITAIWNDRKLPEERDIINQNNFYACVLASAERSWAGGGRQYIESGGTTLPEAGDEYSEFADWERRFIMHKSTSLKGEPIPYIRQTDIRWNVTEMYDNLGNNEAVFAPENGIDSLVRDVTTATGAAVYLRHTWGGIVPGLYGDAPLNRTAYAYTYIYSPRSMRVGALIEFQNYGRSEKDSAPDKGKWDRKGSRIWLNEEEIFPPDWDNAGKEIDSETVLMNENFSGRPPVKVSLCEGWNKVLIKLPYVKAEGVRLNKWMWTFALVDLATGESVEDIVYSPAKTLD